MTDTDTMTMTTTTDASTPVFCVHCGKQKVADGNWAHGQADCKVKTWGLPYRFCKNCGEAMPDVPGSRRYVHDECLASSAT